MCTSITLTPALWHQLATPHPPTSLYVDARMDVAHRRLLKATSDPEYALTEQLLALLAATTPAAPRRTSGRRDRALATAAREAIHARHPAAASLLGLAELLGVSPSHLSRAFTREMGVSLTQQRNRVRVGCALDRLEAGEPDLATLAADLGFADQAHLTRTVRAHTGHTPSALRALLKH